VCVVCVEGSERLWAEAGAGCRIPHHPAPNLSHEHPRQLMLVTQVGGWVMTEGDRGTE